jgi:hypothetical protein
LIGLDDIFLYGVIYNSSSLPLNNRRAGKKIKNKKGEGPRMDLFIQADMKIKENLILCTEGNE